MLFPAGFWVVFTLVVLAGLAATTVAAVLVSTLTSRPARQPSAGVLPFPRPARHDHPKAS
ncbi:hypothetical protein ACYF6T_14735 [Streptomyces sp. 7R007]